MTNSSLRILAVDDEPLILMNLLDMLEDLGHVTSSAANAHSALQKLEQQKYDLIITDLSMPGMSGDELVGRALQLYPDLRVILATGHMELPPGLNSSIVRLGKPYTDDALESALAMAMTDLAY